MPTKKSKPKSTGKRTGKQRGAKKAPRTNSRSGGAKNRRASTQAGSARAKRGSVAAKKAQGKTRSAAKPTRTQARARGKSAKNSPRATVKRVTTVVVAAGRQSSSPATEPHVTVSSLAPDTNVVVERRQQGLGSAAAGQSGDITALSDLADADSESVEELVEEGQDYEAELVSGVERASDEEEEPVPRDERADEEDDLEYGGSE